MSYPSEGIEGFYRNKLSDVKAFLDSQHSGKYKIYNLRAEKMYDIDKFHGKVVQYPFEDHQVPLLSMVHEFCQDAGKWLKSDPRNVVVIHCKAGKGRTGVMISDLLLYLHQVKNPQDAILLYGEKRTHDGKGVTIPSQCRSIEYYNAFLKGEIRHQQPIQLKKVILHPIPTCYQGNNGKWIMFCVYNDSNEMIYDQSNHACIITRSTDQVVIELNDIQLIQGNFKFQFYYYSLWQKYKLFHFWLNTEFLHDTSIQLSKLELDLDDGKQLDDGFLINVLY
ncbi:unnamed protein product [Cunninghamella blakesleeana]